MDDSWRKTMIWKMAKKMLLEDRGALSKEDRQHETTHENYFLGSWLSEDKDGKVK